MTKVLQQPIHQIKIVQNDNNLERSGEIVNSMREYFKTGATLPFEFRREQLKKFHNAIKNNEKGIYEAIRKDMGKPDYEILSTEVGLTLMEISFAIKHLKGWMKKKKTKTPFFNYGTKSYRYPTPKGVVLIIGPWNYPFMLVMNPLIGAIAAGCCAVVKPPDFAFETSKIIQKILHETFDENYIIVIEADGSGTEKLLDLQWDHIFYTGSTRIGKLIQEKATKNLTSVTLELGGINPAIVDKTANIGKAIDSIMYGKWINLGQTCLAPNHIYVHEKIKEKFTSELIRRMKKQFTDNPIESENLARINNPNHHKRLVSLLDEGEILHGGNYSEQDLFVEPTIIVNPNRDKSKILNEEIFGPILPIVTFNDKDFTLDKILEKINAGEEPLSAYLFSNDKKVQIKIVNTLKSQNILINDTTLQFVNPNLPFGGVGTSGIGGYHGYYTFEQFSLIKSVMHQNMPFHLVRWVRRPPYNRIKIFITKFFFK